MSAPEASNPDLPKPGGVIAGKYQVESVLGAGGMGVVVAARHVALRQRVAVKFLHPAAARLPEATARFLREARAVVAIQSEHVARVIDVGTLDNGAPYIVMEHLSGTDMRKVIAQRGPLPVDEVVELLLQAVEAIAEAHAMGLIHRDLKPANLFLTRRAEGSPLVKVLDFGLSKMTAPDAEVSEASLTASSVIIGSPYYMSPEQVRSLKYVDARTDIWALGVILYELLTSKRPFDGPSLTSICVSVAMDTPRPMSAHRPGLPGGLEAVVVRCLEKDPDRRFQSVSELAAALAPFAPTRAAHSIERIGRLLPITSTEASAPELTAAPLAAPLTVSPAATALIDSDAPPPAQPDSQDEQDAATVPVGAWGKTNPLTPRRPIALYAMLGTVAIVAIGGALLVRALVTRAHDAAAPPAPVAVGSHAATARPSAPEPTGEPSASVTAIAAPTTAPGSTLTAAASAAPMTTSSAPAPTSSPAAAAGPITHPRPAPPTKPREPSPYDAASPPPAPAPAPKPPENPLNLPD